MSIVRRPPANLSPQLNALAEKLAEARRTQKQIASLSGDLVPATTDDAYFVNRLVADRLGWEPLGWKIAGTTAFVREKLNIDTPIYGRTFKMFQAQSPARFARGELLDPLIECEFFVTLAKDIPARQQPWTMEDIVEAIDCVHAGIEIAECRFPSSALPPLPAVLADGSASGRYVFGSQILGWRSGLAALDVILEVDGQVKRQGRGSDVMGDPLVPLLWLAEERRRWGEGLRARETSSTGSMTGMLPVRKARSVKATFGGESTVAIDFYD